MKVSLSLSVTITALCVNTPVNVKLPERVTCDRQIGNGGEIFIVNVPGLDHSQINISTAFTLPVPKKRRLLLKVTEIVVNSFLSNLFMYIENNALEIFPFCRS